MNFVVADASALVEYLLGSLRGNDVSPVIEDPDANVHAPALCDVEVASALRGLLLARQIDYRRACDALADYQALPLTRHLHGPFLERVLNMRDNFSAYDAVYVALAEALDASLVTCDAALAKAVGTHAPRIRLAIRPFG